MNEWVNTELQNVAEIIPGFAFKSEHFGDNGEPVIKITDINPPYINIDYAQKVDLSFYNLDKLKKYFLERNDFVVAMTGATIGKVGRNYSSTKAIVNQRVAKIKPMVNVDFDFVYYCIQGNDFQEFIQNNIDSHSAQENISGTSIGRFPILLPPLPEQKAIAGVLSSLDDKIDLLHRQNKTLEAMAETLFQNFFIDNRKATWQECTVGEFADHDKTSTHPNKNPGTFYYHYSIPAFDETMLPVKEVGASILSNKYQVANNVVLFSKLNPHREKRIWLIPDSIPQNSICSTEFQVMKPKVEKYLFFLYGFLNHPQNYDEIAAGVGGTSSSHQRIDPEVIFKTKSFLPDDETLTAYNEMIEPIFLKIDHNRKAIYELADMRDALLPKLMAGEVRVD